MAKNLAGTTIPPGNGGVVFPSPNEWPNAIREISGISNTPQAIINSFDHGFTTSQDVGKTIIGFHNVKGMLQINGLRAYITSVIDVNNFTVAIDTTQFSVYISYLTEQFEWKDCALGTAFFEGNGLTWQQATFPWSGLPTGGEVTIIAGHSPYDPFSNTYP